MDFSNHFERWIALFIIFSISIGIVYLSSFAGNHLKTSKQRFLGVPIFGGILGFIWLVISGQVLLFISKGVISGVEQGDWIIVLRLFGFGESLLRGHIYSIITTNFSHLSLLISSSSYTWAFFPSYLIWFYRWLLWKFDNKPTGIPKRYAPKIYKNCVSMFWFYNHFCRILYCCFVPGRDFGWRLDDLGIRY